VPCATPLGGLLVTVVPVGVAPAALAEFDVGVVFVAVDEVSVDPAADAVAGEAGPVGFVNVVFDEGDGDDGDSLCAESGCANAMPGVLATAAPTPNATANAPTRPTYLALPIRGPFLAADFDNPVECHPQSDGGMPFG
jgi:hypothetical protein